MSGELTQEEIEFLNSVFDLARDGKVTGLHSLITQGVPVDLTNANGDTLLILASYHENIEVVNMLINEGADLDRMNDRGQTALVCAVFRNNLQLAQLFLDSGANPSLGNQTPLDVARYFEYAHMQELLEKH